MSTKHEHQFWTCILNVSAVKEPKLEFIPNKQPIYVLQGKSGEVTCEAELPSISTLKWEKQQNDKSYAAVPNSQVNITEDAKYVRATLKITNAQFADTGTYKCTVQYPPTKSKHKETKITVLGRLALLYSIVRLQYRILPTTQSVLHQQYTFLWLQWNLVNTDTNSYVMVFVLYPSVCHADTWFRNQNMIHFIHLNSCHFHHRAYYKLTMACFPVGLISLMDSALRLVFLKVRVPSLILGPKKSRFFFNHLGF